VFVVVVAATLAVAPIGVAIVIAIITIWMGIVAAVVDGLRRRGPRSLATR
jgi:hypothetical protein